MSKIRVGAVSYLNTKPLIQHLPAVAPEIELRLEVPSVLADELAAGRLDVALIPSVEYFRAGCYSIIPGSAIASRGPVISVKLCSKVPFADIKAVATDVGSRTSVALMQILLRHLFNVRCQTQPLELSAATKDIRADSVLVIGDRAMRIREGDFPFVLDLGYEWSRWTGLPFVWAFWAVAPNIFVSPDLVAKFELAKQMGRAEIPAIARAEAQRLQLDAVDCEYYLSRAIRHDLGELELQGLERFRQLAVAEGLIPKGAPGVLHECGTLIESH